MKGLCTLPSECADGSLPQGPALSPSNKNETMQISGCKVGENQWPPNYECCARTRCYTSAAEPNQEGVCAASTACTGSKFASSTGAIGCFLHKASVQCCVGSVDPTVPPVGTVEPYTMPAVEPITTDPPVSLFPTETRLATTADASAATVSAVALLAAAALLRL